MKVLLERIKELRIKKGLSQSEIASHLDIKQSNYGKLERGENQFTIDKLYKLAELYEVPVFMLFYREGIDDEFVNKEYFSTISSMEEINKSLSTIILAERSTAESLLTSFSNYNSLLQTVSNQMSTIKDLIEAKINKPLTKESPDLEERLNSIKNLLEVMIGLIKMIENIASDNRTIEQVYKKALSDKKVLTA